MKWKINKQFHSVKSLEPFVHWGSIWEAHSLLVLVILHIYFPLSFLENSLTRTLSYPSTQDRSLSWLSPYPSDPSMHCPFFSSGNGIPLQSSSMEWAKASVATEFQLNLSLVVLLTRPHGCCSQEYFPIDPLRTNLHLRVCFQGIQSKIVIAEGSWSLFLPFIIEATYSLLWATYITSLKFSWILWKFSEEINV